MLNNFAIRRLARLAKFNTLALSPSTKQHATWTSKTDLFGNLAYSSLTLGGTFWNLLWFMQKNDKTQQTSAPVSIDFFNIINGLGEIVCGVADYGKRPLACLANIFGTSTGYFLSTVPSMEQFINDVWRGLEFPILLDWAASEHRLTDSLRSSKTGMSAKANIVWKFSVDGLKESAKLFNPNTYNKISRHLVQSGLINFVGSNTHRILLASAWIGLASSILLGLRYFTPFNKAKLGIGGSSGQLDSSVKHAATNSTFLNIQSIVNTIGRWLYNQSLFLIALSYMAKACSGYYHSKHGNLGRTISIANVITHAAQGLKSSNHEVMQLLRTINNIVGNLESLMVRAKA